MYDALVSYRAPAAFYAELIRKSSEPALELGCGTGHPLLDLVEQGLNVYGLDSSADMLVQCAAKAQARGLRVRLHQQEMQSCAPDSIPDHLPRGRLLHAPLGGRRLRAYPPADL